MAALGHVQPVRKRATPQLTSEHDTFDWREVDRSSRARGMSTMHALDLKRIHTSTGEGYVRCLFLLPDRVRAGLELGNLCSRLPFLAAG